MYTVLLLQETKEPLPVEKMNAIWEGCKEDGILLGKGGLYGSVSEPCDYSLNYYFVVRRILHSRI